MVRFKGIPGRPGGNRERRFHPTMVRFKATYLLRPRIALWGFHPTMVRFKGPLAFLSACQDSTVSIPLWCDLKRSSSGARCPSATVSIPLWCDLKSICCHAVYSGGSCFHPTMVRFKDIDGTVERYRNVLVSIPLWCDLKWVPNLLVGPDPKSFPSHYGAI